MRKHSPLPLLLALFSSAVLADPTLPAVRQELLAMQDVDGQYGRPSFDMVGEDSGHDARLLAQQGACVSRDQWKPFEIEDPAGLDARRQDAGMPPMASYQTGMQPSCAKFYRPGDTPERSRKEQVSDPVDVVIDKDGFKAAGETVPTPEALLALLAERHVLKVQIYADSAAVGYEAIGKVIYGTQRAGIMFAGPVLLPQAAP